MNSEDFSLHSILCVKKREKKRKRMKHDFNSAKYFLMKFIIMQLFNIINFSIKIKRKFINACGKREKLSGDLSFHIRIHRFKLQFLENSLLFFIFFKKNENFKFSHSASISSHKCVVLQGNFR